MGLITSNFKGMGSIVPSKGHVPSTPSKTVAGGPSLPAQASKAPPATPGIALPPKVTKKKRAVKPPEPFKRGI